LDLRGTGGAAALRRRWSLLAALLVAVPVLAAFLRYEAQLQGWLTLTQGLVAMTAVTILLLGLVVAVAYRSEVRLVLDLEASRAAAEERATLLQRQEANLRQAKAEHDAFFERNHDLLALVGFDGTFRSVNPAWTRILGYRPDELVGTPFLRLVHPDDQQRTQAEAGRLSATGEPMPFENRYLAKDGSERWLRWTSTTSPELQLFLASAKDVTAQRAAQEALVAAESRFRALFDRNPSPLAIKRADGSGFIDANDAFQRLVGRPRSTLVDPAFDHVAIWTDRGIRDLLLKRLREDGRAEGLDLGVRRPDGEARQVVASVQRMDLDGVDAFVLALQDVTEAKEAQAAAERARERFATVFRLSPVPICLTKEDGRFVDVNGAFCRLVGRGPEDLLAGHVTAPDVWEDPEERKRMLVAIRERGIVRDLELRVKRPDGEVRTTLASIEFIDLGGDTTILSLLQDITDRQRMQEEREKRMASEAELDRLRRTDAFRSEFINNIAHELATPLTPLVLKVKALAADKALTPAQRASIETLERNVQRLRHLVDDMVGAADLQARSLALDKRRLNLTRELRAAVAAHHPSAERAGLVMDEPDDTGLTVSADPARLQLVLGHLLGNAIKFTPKGGRVSVSSRRAGDEVRVEVKDTGLGLTRKQMEGLWRPFAQAHDKSQRTDSGSGLGLYVTKGIVELHGGEVGCSSPGPGQGSTFWFTLPLATGHVDPLARAKQAEPEGEPRRNLNPGVAEDA
jgi:PAS domain S-box-containing protein